jgi:hypothetical protein
MKRGVRADLSGQAMVEAAATFGILMLLFFCVYSLFLLSIDKIRSLDTVYHISRTHQVGKTRFAGITRWCFGRPGQIAVRHQPGPMPAVDELQFQFAPRGMGRMSSPWTSTMRTVVPHPGFLTRSWPGAREDSPL